MRFSSIFTKIMFKTVFKLIESYIKHFIYWIISTYFRRAGILRGSKSEGNIKQVALNLDSEKKIVRMLGTQGGKDQNGKVFCRIFGEL